MATTVLVSATKDYVTFTFFAFTTRKDKIYSYWQANTTYYTNKQTERYRFLCNAL